MKSLFAHFFYCKKVKNSGACLRYQNKYSQIQYENDIQYDNKKHAVNVDSVALLNFRTSGPSRIFRVATFLCTN